MYLYHLVGEFKEVVLRRDEYGGKRPRIRSMLDLCTGPEQADVQPRLRRAPERLWRALDFGSILHPGILTEPAAQCGFANIVSKLWFVFRLYRQRMLQLIMFSRTRADKDRTRVPECSGRSERRLHEGRRLARTFCISFFLERRTGREI